MNNFIIKNKLKEIAKKRGVSNKLIAIMLNVHYTTVSHWISNRYQPNSLNIGKLMNLLEVDFNDLIIVENSIEDTGLGKILEKEFKELVKKYPLKIDRYNLEKENVEQIYNPKIVNKLIDIEIKHKNNNK